MRSKRQVRRRRICGISDRVDLLPNQIAPGKRSAPTIHFANSVGGNEGAFVLVSRCKKKKKEIGLPFFEPLTLQDMLRKEERKEVEEEKKRESAASLNNSPLSYSLAAVTHLLWSPS